MCPYCYRPACDCRCNRDHCHSPAAPTDERYLTLESVARQRTLGVAPNRQTLTYLTSAAQGFVLDDGTGTGQFIAKAPNWQLVYVNPASGGSYPNSGTFTSILVCNDSEGAPWKMVHAPSSGSFFLKCVDGQFSFSATTEIPGLNLIYANAASATSIEAIGFIQTGTDGDGDPIFATRKLTSSGTVDQYLVLHYNGTTGRYEITATTSTTALTRQTINVRNFIGLDSDGNAITDGFDVQPSSATLANISLLAYDKAAHRLYRAPGPVAVNASVASPISIGTTGTYTTIFDFGTVAVTYPNVFVSFSAGWYDDSAYKWGLYVDGTLVHEWDFTQIHHNSADEDVLSISAGCFVKTGLTIGNHSFVLKAQIAAGYGTPHIVKDGSASLFTIAG